MIGIPNIPWDEVISGVIRPVAGKKPDPNVALVCWEKNNMDMVDFETCSV